MTDLAPPLTLDPENGLHARAIRRLDTEQIAWFTSVRPSGFPHAVPVWFLWRDGCVLVLSEPDTVKVGSIRANPKVLVHLEAGDDGEHLTVVQGIAEIDDEPAGGWIDRIGDEYAAKYAAGLARIGLTMESMAAQYSCVIRVTPTRLIAW